MSNNYKIGIIVSTKMKKTVTVSVETNYLHKKYKKLMKYTKKYLAHCENLSSNIGDFALIKKCAPYSRNKNWEVTEIFNS